FIGVLLEHYAGALPLWLSPVQVAIANINENQLQYCKELYHKLRNSGVRVIFDDRNEKIGHKIRENAMQKIPYIIVAGDKEKEAGSVAVRARGNKDLGMMKSDDFITLMQSKSVPGNNEL
ncbi:MAG: His/Gly/Thr/Pro-type tRNA ligase C-terminal domain-containing protein, partial [Endomicrobia bacterium]|nr:His/Gly/Thr/Pro-type tRNA ligase C-terminal domain-containing protein [Endomicrobiia bacterium]